MTSRTPTLCFTCGLAVDDQPRLNHLPDGRACPACRDRLLDSLPSLLPNRGELVHELEGHEKLSLRDSFHGVDDWAEPHRDEPA